LVEGSRCEVDIEVDIDVEKLNLVDTSYVLLLFLLLSPKQQLKLQRQ
jgi:hypothetical protein